MEKILGYVDKLNELDTHPVRAAVFTMIMNPEA